MRLNVGIPTSNGRPLILPNQRSDHMKNSIGTISNLTVEIWYFLLKTCFLCYSNRHAPSAKIWILQSNRYRLWTASLWRDTDRWNSTKSLATYVHCSVGRYIFISANPDEHIKLFFLEPLLLALFWYIECTGFLMTFGLSGFGGDHNNQNSFNSPPPHLQLPHQKWTMHINE